MIDALFSQTNYVATKKMLDATALRHEAIASNLANLETPGYKRVDVTGSFQEELSRAMGSRDAESISQMRPTLAVDPTVANSTKDGNTVELESELMHLSQNTLAHTLETQLITGNLVKLRLAITGRTS